MSTWTSGTALLAFAVIGAAGLAPFLDWPAPSTPEDGNDVAELFDPAYVGRRICGVDGKHRSQFFKPGLFVSVANATTNAASADTGPPLFDNLGSLGYPITTSSATAQQYFDQGLRFSHAFNFEAAAASFREAERHDPTCAMCYWGEAFALGPNINAGMDSAAIEPAFAAVAKALALANGTEENERALIEALALRYSPDPKADRVALNQAYADAMAVVAKAHPDDHAIATMYADAVMNTSPWDYWEADGRTPKGEIGEAITAIEAVLAKDPDHPLAIHLYIHLVEATQPERAEPYAERLAATMPGAGHIVHMPSHIYFRVGRYLDSLASNWGAVAADEFYLQETDPAGSYRYSYYPHNVHFLLESARMAGDAETALEAAGKLPGTMSDEVARALPWVEIIKAAPYFAHAQFSPPEVTLAVADPGGEFPYVKAMWHYARGVAKATAGEGSAAAVEAEAIAEIEAANDWTHMVEGGVPAPELLQLARHIIQARTAQAAGDADTAVAEFEQAVAIQDALPYLEPPYWYYPVRQSLGAALLQANRADDALQVFQKSLLDAPNNGWALFGLMKAQEALGDDAGATRTAELLDAAWAGEADFLDLARL